MNEYVPTTDPERPVHTPAPEEVFIGDAVTLSFGYYDGEDWVNDGRTYITVRLDTNPRLGVMRGLTILTPEALAALREEIVTEVREQVAREIEAKTPEGYGDACHDFYIEGMKFAARIARNPFPTPEAIKRQAKQEAEASTRLSIKDQ